VRERLIRLFWPALVVGAFCLPLFVGLGNRDLRGDEAGHSFSVDRILETGEWLIPRSSPHPDAPFLEKPPLKFWIVAAGILAGLPHDEFGLRFWDPVFGGLAFLYVFGIGRRLAGPLCGAIAVLIMFVDRNLMFEHGLRDNAMEAPLLLSYCGGVFHYLKWTSPGRSRARFPHAVAVAVYFALGFMVKFVAALFLPAVLGLATILVGGYRRRALQEWRTWAAAWLLAVVLIAPWFVYCTVLFGREFWGVILGTHVYARLTGYLDPAHLQPWHHYLTETHVGLTASNAFWLVVAGAVVLVIDTIRRRSAEGFLALIWFALPVTVISFGTSKLYHYAYPFLPPLALAGGYVVARLWRVLPPALDRALDHVHPAEWTALWSSRLAGFLRMPAVGAVMLFLGAVAVGMFVWTLFVGPFNFTVGGITIRNSRLVRPALIATLLLILSGRGKLSGRLWCALLILLILPIPAYRATLNTMQQGTRVFRPTRDCVVRVAARPEMMAAGARGMYVDGDGIDYQLPFNHEFSYYFRNVQPWIRPRQAPPSRLYQFVADPSEQRPLLISASRYHDVLPEMTAAAGTPLSLPRVRLHDDALLVLPGPYGVCGAEHMTPRERP
jgi:4-amino-4-deoxy-L-arabinose transferase-like glycosyltransferase